MCKYEEETINAVAMALEGAMPGLVNPEAWPWRILAVAALDALEKHWTDSRPAGPFIGAPQEPPDVP